MAEQKLCTFFVNEIYFGIDIKYVQEVIRSQVMTHVPLAPPDICGLINLRGQILTAIDLQRRLEMGESFMRSTAKFVDEVQGFNIVVCSEDEEVSLLVDEVGDVLEFTTKTFQPPPATLKGKMRQMLAGAYPLEEGFVLVLDIKKILN
ncbi:MULTISPECIES: chemotaxis protein CheW [Nostocales]|uniref:Chemotaxis protein CheW n=3 Tax=Nostocales TaxID=1161 RepID=A0A0C1N9D0_9CYAN|nr:chemotaxis protein CheW [Tolypothrix bouteillei]KAF3887328.1 chemotaxis protein CheW [Tolypothrix bouteillei VB521301]